MNTYFNISLCRFIDYLIFIVYSFPVFFFLLKEQELIIYVLLVVLYNVTVTHKVYHNSIFDSTIDGLTPKKIFPEISGSFLYDLGECIIRWLLYVYILGFENLVVIWLLLCFKKKNWNIFFFSFCRIIYNSYFFWYVWTINWVIIVVLQFLKHFYIFVLTGTLYRLRVYSEW